MPIQPQTRVLRIDITGHDHPGVTHSLTAILARREVRILDIGQALIHDTLALGMLVELTDEMKSSTLLTDLLLEAHRLGVQIRFTAVTGEEYGTVGLRAEQGPLHRVGPRPVADGGAPGGGERRDRQRRAEHRSHRSPVSRTPLDDDRRRAGVRRAVGVRR